MARKENASYEGAKQRKQIMDFSQIYPVGSIYMSVSKVDPGMLFGGTWEQIKDRFLLSAGDAYSGGSTGGKTEHTHKYGIQYGAYYRDISLENNANAGILNYLPDGTTNLSESDFIDKFEAEINYVTTENKRPISMSHFRETGNVSYASNLPPYLTVYVWKRTA